MTSAERNEQRRLNAILNDEQYGPALVRLKRSEQREILELIDQNRGKEARTRILFLDRQRKSIRRAVDVRAKARAMLIKTAEVAEAEGANVDRFGTTRWHARQVGPHIDQRMNANRPTRLQLLDIANATVDQIRQNASSEWQSPYSVWWYH